MCRGNKIISFSSYTAFDVVYEDGNIYHNVPVVEFDFSSSFKCIKAYKAVQSLVIEQGDGTIRTQLISEDLMKVV